MFVGAFFAMAALACILSVVAVSMAVAHFAPDTAALYVAVAALMGIDSKSLLRLCLICTLHSCVGAGTGHYVSCLASQTPL